MAETRVPAQLVNYETSDYIPPAVQVGYWPRTHLVARLALEVREPGAPVVDIGCNAGHLLALLGPPCWGYDIADSPLAFGRADGHDVRKANITSDDLDLTAVVTIAEVLEHLDDPHAMVARLNRDPVRYLIASSPYLETEHDHYEQHCWVWDLEGFAAMFTDAGWRVAKHETVESHQAILVTRGH